uniref:Uncharacterized protein n=1 Tax=Arundo donax TaxID=35708 RepID=A0A0A9CEU7_ARUDO
MQSHIWLSYSVQYVDPVPQLSKQRIRQ